MHSDLSEAVSRWLAFGLVQSLFLAGLLVGGQGSLQAAEAARPGPLEPAAAQQAFVLHPDCRIINVAAEPDVIDPVHLAFGPDGRLWVVEYSDYPNGPDPGTPGKSRIRVLTDADQDGRYDAPVTFAEGLLFANSLMLWRDGVLVTTDGKILFLKDSDGDGRADVSQEWFTGFVTENPQLRCNHPTLGLDGWIYVANGLRGGAIIPGKDDPWKETRGQDGSQPVSISGMDFRFDPLTGAYEAVSGNGQFGLCFDDYGNRFVCSNRNPCKQIVLEDSLLKSDPELPVERVFEDVSPAAENSRLYPISRTWTTSNLHANQFTAACGVTIFRGAGLGPAFYGNSFTCEPTANLVHRDLLTPRGATFTSRPDRDGVEFLATTDEWFRPVNLAHGPDGALYIADMYRAVIEHPQFMPDELKSRPDLLLGMDRGRIWKVLAHDSMGLESRVRLLAGLSLEKLIPFLGDPNVWQRETAFRLLLEKADSETAELLKKYCETATDPRGIVNSLWLLHRLQALEAIHVRTALSRQQPLVTAQAVQLLRRETEGLTDLNRTVRTTYLEAVAPEVEELLFSLASQVKPDSRTPEKGADAYQGSLLFQLLQAFPAEDAPLHRLTSYVDVLDNWGEDPFLRAVTLRRTGKQASMLASMLLQREFSASHSPSSGRVKAIRDLSQILGRRNQSFDVQRLLDRAFSKVETSENQPALERIWKVRCEVLQGLAAGMRQGNLVKQALAESSYTTRQEFQGTVDQSISYLSGPDSKPELGLDLVRLLAFDDRPKVREALVKLLDHPALATLSVEMLAQRADDDISDLFLSRYSRATPSVKSRIIQAMASNSLQAQRLLDAVGRGQIGPVEIDPATTQRLLKSRDPLVQKRATELLQQARPADRAQVLADYKACLQLTPSSLNGREIFRRNCSSCHKVGDVGVNVAPDISDSRVRTTEYLLTHILDPNLAIDNNYFSYTVVDTDGRIFTGVIESETASAVTLKQPEGKSVTIPRADIEEMKSSGMSLMPVGLEKNIDHQQMADLIGFIKNWRYLDGQVPGVETGSVQP